MADRLTGDVCKNLLGNLFGITGSLVKPDKVAEGLTNQLTQAGNFGQLLPVQPTQTQSQNQMPVLGGLGGVSGILGNKRQSANRPQKQRPIFPGSDGLFDF